MEGDKKPIEIYSEADKFILKKGKYIIELNKKTNDNKILGEYNSNIHPFYCYGIVGCLQAEKQSYLIYIDNAIKKGEYFGANVYLITKFNYIPYEGDISDDMSERLIQTHDITEGSVDVIGKGLININSADKNELMTLPGIGEKKAEDIIRYREDNGGFKSVEDLMNVDGIKEGTFQKLKDKITI